MDKHGRERLALTTPEQQEKALIESHDESNHGGFNKTLRKLEMAYYWTTMVKDVRDWVAVIDFSVIFLPTSELKILRLIFNGILVW